MKGAIIGIDKINGQAVYRVITMSYKNKAWKFSKKMVNEAELINAIKKGFNIINAKVDGNRIKGSTGDLKRFNNNVNNPLVILSELVDNNGTILGYKVATCEGTVKNIKQKELTAYCERISRKSGIPIQNGMYISEKDGQKAHIRSYPGGEYFKEVIERKKASNAKKPEINQEKTKSALERLEEIFSKEQIKELQKGRENKVNFKVYANPKLSAEQMAVIRGALEKGLNGSLIADPAYSIDAMKYLVSDMKYGVDVSYYLNPAYSAEQLSVLGDGFISGVDVSKYADPKLTPEQMTEIRVRLENNIWKEHEVKAEDSWKQPRQG